MKKFNTPFFFLILLLSASVVSVRAQLPQGLSGKRIAYAIQDKGKLKAILYGENAKQITRSEVLITKFTMKTFRNGDTNQLEVVAEAPECLANLNASVASSAGPIKAYTAATNLYIEGVGFFCQQSNALLVISNNVETIIRKDFLQSRSKKDSVELLADSPASTNQILKIYSDHFQFLYESNLISYAGNVRVEDSQMELTCDVLNIFLTTNKTIQRITAENHVVVVNKQDHSRATGKRAVYVVNPNREFVQLLGHPTWSDGSRNGTADVFVFDRKSNIFRAETNAVFKLPREQIGQPGLLSSGATRSTNVQTGEVVEISADTISFKLPQTNAPVREIVAENQVVISSESDQSRATADKAVYNEGTGIVELTGKPVWKIAQGEIRANVLAIGRTNQFFSARTNVYMKFPAKLFANSLKVGAATNASPATNRWVEIFCDDFLYATNHARLDGNVRANLLDENGSLTTLLCGIAEISFGPNNQVEIVSAEKNVVLQELPGAALQTNLLKKTITCDVLRVKRSVETGLLESLHAEKNVVGEEIEKTKLGETLKRISAEVVDVKFSPTANQIQNVIAKGSVFAEKIERVGGTNKTVQARGEKAVYQLGNGQESVELLGGPSAWTDSILLSDAKLIRWNLKTGKLGAIPYKVTPLNSTNRNMLEMLKRKK
jgi:lipopolysaccharide export system protein LptA